VLLLLKDGEIFKQQAPVLEHLKNNVFSVNIHITVIHHHLQMTISLFFWSPWQPSKKIHQKVPEIRKQAYSTVNQRITN
jgi:hypothetical protein